jgi:hypothetical protein
MRRDTFKYAVEADPRGGHAITMIKLFLGGIQYLLDKGCVSQDPFITF